MAQWPTTCVDLNDIVEAHLGNDGNVGIYQREFGDQAEQECQNDHRDDVRGVFAWAFGGAQYGAVDAGYNHSCSVLTDGTVTCWGLNAASKSTPPPSIFQAVSSGAAHVCGLRNRAITCWGSNTYGQATRAA